MDDYNDASRLVEGNFDDPRLTDYDTLLANVADLKRGETTKAPIYDFKQSRRVGYREVAVPEARIVIIEGIYALSSRIRPLLDLRVSVTGGVHFDLVKRVLRDITRSGQEPEAIIQQISDTVYPMYKAYIEPDLKSAHLRIYNTFNPFTGFMDATYILKSDVAVTDEQVLAVLGPQGHHSHSAWGGAGMGCESGAATPTTGGAAAAAAHAAASSPISTPAAAFSTPQSALGAAAAAPAPAAAAAAPASSASVSSCSPPRPPPPLPPTTTATAASAAALSAPPSTTASPRSITRDESETYDIYLLPPNEDPETCSSWLRMRNRDGRYSLMFEEWVVDGPFIISPRITFEVGVRVLGGLMALGYEIGTIMRRTSRAFSNGHLAVKFDDIEGMGRTFVQVQGKDRAAVAAAGAALGLEGSYSPRSYIEMVQLEKLTESFRTVTDDLRRRFAVGGEPLFDAEGLGTPPSAGGGSFGNGNALAFGGSGGGGVGTGRGRGRGGRRKNQEAPSFTRTTGFNPPPSASQQQQQKQSSRPLTLTQSAPTNGSSALLARLQREGDDAGSSDDDDDKERGGDDDSSCSSSSDDDGRGDASPHRKHFSAAKAAAKRALVEAERQEELKLQQREAARRSTGSGAGGGGMGTGAGGSTGTSRSSSDPGNAAIANGGGRHHPPPHQQQQQQQQQLQSAALRLATGTPVPPSAGAAAAAAVSAAAAAAAAHNNNNGNEGRISPLSLRSDGSLDTVAAAALALDGNNNSNGRRHLGSISGDINGLPPFPSPSSSSYPATTDAQAVLADAMARLATAVDSVDRRSAARVAWASGALGAALGAGVALMLAKAMR